MQLLFITGGYQCSAEFIRPKLEFCTQLLFDTGGYQCRAEFTRPKLKSARSSYSLPGVTSVGPNSFGQNRCNRMLLAE